MKTFCSGAPALKEVGFIRTGREEGMTTTTTTHDALVPDVDAELGALQRIHPPAEDGEMVHEIHGPEVERPVVADAAGGSGHVGVRHVVAAGHAVVGERGDGGAVRGDLGGGAEGRDVGEPGGGERGRRRLRGGVRPYLHDKGGGSDRW